MANEWAKVKRSTIHGRGVFAKRSIPKGTYIMEYKGKKITNKEADRISESEKKKGTVFLFELNSRYTLDGNKTDNPARYINHSCSPNAESFIEKGKIWICSLRNIQPNEEITYDYQLVTDDPKDHPCRCNTKKCIGSMV